MQTLHVTSHRKGALGLIEAMSQANQTPKDEQPTESPIQHNGDVTTISLFWDCECKTRHIHYRALQTSCLRCFATSDESPDSRIEEVARYGILTSTPIGFYVDEGVRSAYFLIDTMQDRHGNFIPVIAVEGIHGNFSTVWQFGKDKQRAESIIEELNASLGLTMSDVYQIRLSTMKF